MLWMVAGCLFEVSFPTAAGPWQWTNPSPEVTLVAEEERGPAHHFRFRAEAAGEVELRFAGEAAPETETVAVRIAPERLA
ncbi:MAG: hypothetical protein ACRD2W_18420 [Acidimicrobiales bacterium]